MLFCGHTAYYSHSTGSGRVSQHLMHPPHVVPWLFMPPVYISKAVSSRKAQSESCKDVWQNNKIIYSNVSTMEGTYKAKRWTHWRWLDSIKSGGFTVCNFFACEFWQCIVSYFWPIKHWRKVDVRYTAIYCKIKAYYQEARTHNTSYHVITLTPTYLLTSTYRFTSKYTHTTVCQYILHTFLLKHTTIVALHPPF